jgi:FlaA1/EpsC-like NDP-sugar epimerase
MELALLSAGTRFGFHVTSARFANVAFSAGSLLHSWHDRLRLRQPIPAPRETWRYFVSGEEAAHICLLATSILPTGSIAIPVFSPESDSRLLDSVAAGFIRNAGYRPKVYHSETTAKAAITSDIAAGEWPLLLTPRDTQGEKEKEVFLAETESALATTCDSLLRIPSAAPPEALDSVLRQLELWVTGDDGRVSRSSVAQVVQRVVPEFRPSTADQRLDDRL